MSTEAGRQISMPLPDACTEAVYDWQAALRRMIELGLVTTAGASGLASGDTVAILVQATDAGRDALRRVMAMEPTS